MRLPRITVRAMFLAVVAVAIDCALVRAMLAREQQTEALLPLLALALPLEHALGLGLLFWINGRRRWFWGGFEVAGLAACGVMAWASWSDAPWFSFGLESAVKWLEDRLRRPGRSLSHPAAWYPFEDYVLIPLLVFLAQITLAVAGGTIANWLGSRVAPAAPVDRPRSRRRQIATALVFLSFFVLPAAAIEGLLRRVIDPDYSRLEPGTVAIVDEEGGLRAMLEDGSSRALPIRTRVRVEDDTEDHSYVFVFRYGPGASLAPLPDSRGVAVTILEGRWAGHTTTLPRCSIRPAH
jgi:hypothetical protein